MLRKDITLAVAVACAGCGGIAESAPIVASGDSLPAPVRLGVAGPCDTILNSFVCARVIEATLLTRQPEVRREGPRLLLPLEGGRELVVVDSVINADKRIAYSYAGALPTLNAYIVHVQYYEGTAHLLLFRRTGTRVRLDDVPVPSPSGIRVLTLSGDLELTNPNRARVYRVTGDSLHLEWELEPDDWEPVTGRWLSDTSFAIARGRSVVASKTLPALRGITLVLDSGSWRVDSVAPLRPN